MRIFSKNYFYAYFTQIVFTLAALFLSACGDEDDLIRWIQAIETGGSSEYKPLVFASKQEIAAGEVEEGQYIVAFRQQEMRSGLYFNSLMDQRNFHNQSIGLLTLGDAAVKSVRYISSVSLADPGNSFYWKFPQIKPQDLLPYRSSLGPKDLQEAHLTSISFASDQQARRVLKSWLEQKKIWFAEPNRISKTSGVIEERLIQTFDDPDEWPSYNQVGLIAALTNLNDQKEKGVPVIAILDSGIDVAHPALELQVYRSEEAVNKLCRDDYNGCNTNNADKDFLGDGSAFPAGTSDYGESCESIPNCNHGTHVAGIAAGLGSNKFTGICPYCQLLNVRIVNDKGSISDSAILSGLAYTSGFQTGGEPLVRIVNASFGKYSRNRAVELFIRALSKFGKGILMIAASGNEGSMKRQYPGAFTDVLAVANIDARTFRKDAGSNFGVWIDISAPGSGGCKDGGGILSSVPGDDYLCQSGTSMATPVVAGVAGLLLAVNPNLTIDELRRRIINGAVANELYADGVNDVYRSVTENGQLTPLLGAGVVNAYYSVFNDAPKDPPALFETPERVGRGCAVIGLPDKGHKFISSSKTPPWSVVILALLLLTPVGLLLVRNKV